MIYLITGGSGSGKSTYAESLMMRFSPPYHYIATMIPYGEEARRRIDRHRRIRAGKGFETIERALDLSGVEADKNASALLECMGNIIANEMFEENGAGENAEEAVMNGIRHLAAGYRNLVIVTNEVGSDGCDYGEGTMDYMRLMGKINCMAAEMADGVCEVSGGTPVWLKGAGV